MDVMRRLIFPALLGLAAYYAIFGGEYSLLDIRRIRVDREQATTALVGLYSEADSLSVRAEALENDPQTLETLARESFGMIRDGEVLYRFANSDSGSEAGNETEVAER